MIVILKHNPNRDQMDSLIAWLQDKEITIHTSIGESNTILGLVGDTSKLDIDLIAALDIVEDVKRVQEPYKNANRKFHPEDTVIQVGNTQIDLRCYEVRVEGENVVLSPKEVEILHLMASQPRQVFTREQLLDSIWGFDFDGDSRVVDTSIKRIRKKLDSAETDFSIETVWGYGYKVTDREND